MNQALLLATALLLPTLSSAQEQRAAPPVPERPAIRTDGGSFILPAGEIALPELIDAAAAYLDRNILVNPTEVLAGGQTAGIVLQQPIVVDAPGCEELLYSLLYVKGFAVVPIDAPKGCYEVISMNGPRGGELGSRPISRSVAEVLRRPTFKEYVLVTVPLQHINATVATAALRPFFASAGSPGRGSSLTLGNIGNNTSLLLMGFGDQVAAALRMLQECDQAPPADQQPKPLVERVANLEAALARLQAQVEALTKAK